MKAALLILRNAGGQLSTQGVIEAIPNHVNLDSYALEPLKGSSTRWRAVLAWNSVDLGKAGFLVKERGVWYLTADGDKAADLPEEELAQKAWTSYREWAKSQPVAARIKPEEQVEPELDQESETEWVLDEVEGKAAQGLLAHLNAMDEWEFQKFVAALLRGMGYYTPFIAPRNTKDGGRDIVAYKDPIGAEIPRIKVQCKHRESKASASEVRELKGVLNEGSEVGVFVSTEGFSPDARFEARNSPKHIELIDGVRLINLWRQFYEKLSEEDRARMPLRPVYFLDLSHG